MLWDLKSIVMTQTPTVIVTQPLDLMKMISREQLSDSRDMGFVHSFRLESVLESTKKEQLQTDNYNCQISQIFLFSRAFFNALKDLSGYRIPVQETQEIAF